MLLEMLRPVMFVSVIGWLLLPANIFVLCIAAMLLLHCLGFRTFPHHTCHVMMGNRVFHITICVTACAMLKRGRLAQDVSSNVSFVCALLIGAFLGFFTFLKMDADVGPYLRRRYISTCNGGSIRGVEAHEVLWALYVSPFYMLSSGLFFALGGWWGCLQANAAAVILTVVFHVLCYMGTDFPPDERKLGAWGRPISSAPASERRERRAARAGYRERDVLRERASLRRRAAMSESELPAGSGGGGGVRVVPPRLPVVRR